MAAIPSPRGAPRMGGQAAVCSQLGAAPPPPPTQPLPTPATAQDGAQLSRPWLLLAREDFPVVRRQLPTFLSALRRTAAESTEGADCDPIHRPTRPSTPGPPWSQEGPIRGSPAEAPRPGFWKHPAKGLPAPLAAAPRPWSGRRQVRQRFWEVSPWRGQQGQPSTSRCSGWDSGQGST